MAEIDQLTIGIEAEAPKAAKTIDSLVSKLDILVKRLSAVATTPVKINIDASGFEKLENAINISGIEKATKSIQGKMSIATKAIENFEEKYKDLGKGFSLKGSTEYIQKQIDSLTNQLAKAKLAKEDFEKSGKTDLTGYETAVKNAIKYTNQIESLKNQISDLQNVKPDIDFKINGIEEAAKQISDVSEKIKTVSISESAFNYNADAMRAVFGEMAAGVDNWYQAVQKFGTNAGEVLNQTSTETDNLNAKTKQFEESLKSLKIPPINTDNIDVLKKQLTKAEEKFEALKTKLENGINTGRITESVDDKGYVKLQEQIALTEKTAAALRDRIEEVGKEAKNASGIKEVGKSANSASHSFSDLAKSGKKASNSLKKMQDSLKGVLKAMLPILGIRELFRFGKESIKSSMDYLEVLNYFDASFGQVAANADLSSFEEMGYSSAEAYYSSFAQRAEELTRKMSGFTIGEDGLLESTGTVSLGLDPSQLMNYQAMFGQMSSSMGVSSENALKLSQALTEIGADLASIKNLEFETVWNDMASGLAGMSRTLDKYGVNIRNVNLQQKLMELGIDANIQSLNQNDKALLRAIILLENTKYAWGDLADTINQPANQLRMIEANFQNLARTIGNLFLPLVKTVLPYVNALVIAVQRLFAWLGNLMGIDISGISTSIGGADMGDILDQTDDLASGLGGAKEEADKLNKSLRQFDELKVISTKQDDGGAGSGGGIQGGLLDSAFEDAFSKYQQVWDEAFGNLENRAQEIAYKIEKAFEPVKKIIQDFAIGDFFQAGKDTSALVVSITDFFADAIDKVDWYGIGKKIGDFLAGVDWLAILKSVGNLIWQALKAAFELYVGAFSAAPLETALISLVAFPKLLKAITASKFITGIGKLWKNFKVWGEKISLVTGALAGNKAAASGLYMLYPKLGAKVDTVKTAFSKFFSSVKTNGFWKTVNGSITNIRNNLGGLQKAAIVAVAGFAEFSVVSDSVEKLTLGTENWLAEIGKIAGVVAAAGAAMYVALGPAGLVMAAVTGLTAGIIGVENAMQQINAETIGNTIRNALENPGGVSMDEIAGAFNEKMSSIASSFDNVSQHSQALETAQTNIKNTYGEISSIESAMSQGAISVEDGVKRINEAFAGLSTDFNDAITALKQGIIGALGEGSVLRQYLSAMGYDVEALNGIVVGDVANIQKEFDKLAAEYESIKESTNPEDIARKEEIIRTMTAISGVFDETSQNMTAFKTSVENMHLNMGSVINTEDIGAISFESERFGDSLQSMVDSYNSASSSIEQGNETFQNNLATLSNMLKAAGIEENTATYSEIMSKIPDITTFADSDLKKAFSGIIATIQQDALNEIPALIEQAGKEWETLDFETRSELNYQGITNKDAYIASVVESYKEDVLSPMEEQINNALKSLNIDEEGVMIQKAQELYDSLFSYDYEWDLGGGERIFKMEENWKQILQEADLPGISEKYGKKASGALYDSLKEEIPGWAAYSEEGLAKAVEEKLTDISNTGDLMGDALDKGARARLGIKSPSTVFAEIGMYSALGFNKGIEGNTQSTIDTVYSYIDKIKQTFTSIVSVFEEIGKMVMQGFESGMSQMEGGLYDKANSIADNITQTIKSALEIHSPSRVMFELGDYTMQGFQKGMENLYQPILSSVKGFSYDVSVAPAPLTDVYSGYQYQPTFTPQYGFADYPQGGYNQSNAETNALLRQILSAIKEGKTITIGQDEVGRASVRYIQGEERRLQKSLVGIY